MPATGITMQPVSILLNLLWILIGGAWMAFGWLIAAIIMAITIIGIPWARAAFNIAVYTLLPFGSRAVRRDEVTGMEDIGTGPLGVIGNIIWFVLAGWWLALGHLVTAILLAVTIIEQVPPLHVSVPLQKRPSLHDAVLLGCWHVALLPSH